jgi:alpha-amylase
MGKMRWLFVLCALSLAHGKSKDEWKSRIIYQLLTDRFAQDQDPTSPCSDLSTYCGGTFDGITRKLDYIQGLGANAIWISPIPSQTPNGYHGYWQMDINQINSHFGTESDLESLVKECHNRGMWVMLDVVGNHMGNQKNGDWNDFSFFSPFNEAQHYHSYCLITNFNNQTEVEICRLANLPDLNQTNTFVSSTLTTWIHNTVSRYDFDGLRVDTTPEVAKSFWSQYSKSAGVFTMGEVFNGNPSYVAGYQGALDSTLNYPMYFKLKNAFQERQSMRNIHDGVTQNSVFSDVSVLGNFLDNYDNPRFLSNDGDIVVLMNALAYVVFAEGIPIIYYGTEQAFHGTNDPHDRESLWPYYNTSSDLYLFLATINKFRTAQGSAIYNEQQVERYVDDQFFAFTRGMVFVATSNIGNGQGLSRTITYHPYTDGTKLVNVLDSSDTVTVNGGRFTVNIKGGMPKVYHPTASAVLEEEREVDTKNNSTALDHTMIGIVVSAGLVLVLVAVLAVVVVLVWGNRRLRARAYSELS